jgi:small membrane protein
VQIIVQVALVLAVIIVSLALMRGGSNARHLAIRRIMLVLFACVAAFSIFFPELLTRVARLLGIGRGTDLVLYGLIVSFMVFMATTYQRFRHMESTLTKLSRRIALDETPPPSNEAPPQSQGVETDRRLTPPAHGGP